MGQVSVDIPGKGRATIQFLNMYPELLPLLIGRVSAARVDLGGPEIQMMLPKGFAPDKESKKTKPMSPATFANM